MASGIVIALISLHIINIPLHGFGTYILVRLIRHRKARPQLALLLGLGSTETVLNFFEALKHILTLVQDESAPNRSLKKVTVYIEIIDLSAVWLVLYLVMYYITLDRFLAITMGVKYHAIVTKKKALVLLLITWIMAIIFALISLFAFEFLNFDWEDAFFKYFYPTFDISFAVFSVSCYTMIFCKYQKSQHELAKNMFKSPRRMRRSLSEVSNVSLFNSEKATTGQLFWRSKFYTSILLVLTFLVFLIIPDLIYLFHGVINGNTSSTLLNACWLCFAFCNFTDAIIYMFLQPRVKEELLILIRWKKRKRNDVLRNGDITLHGDTDMMRRESTPVLFR